MDTSNLVAAWLSFAVTAAGLGGLISQASAINEKLDPFHASRTAEYLGIWFQRQHRFPWWRIAKPPPQGPVIVAKMSEGFCGVNTLHITRIPLYPTGKAGWAVIMTIFNSAPPLLPGPRDGDTAEKASLSLSDLDETAHPDPSSSWVFLEKRPLKRHQSSACVIISRVTLIVMLCVTNARPVFQYSDASGFRAGYASYAGQFYITWPIGEEAIVKFATHDSIGQTEVLPRSFAHRVDRCGQMVCGIVSAAGSDFNVAFCGRKAAGVYELEHAPKGFQGAHGSRHLYNMLGGKAYQVDCLFARPCVTGQVSGEHKVLELPGKDGSGPVKMVVKPREEAVIKQALDCLPWTSLSWSIHRGMRDVLVAYAKPIMDAHRQRLAELLRQTVADRADVLRLRGWDPEFVRNNMAHMAASAVLAGHGNSGDSVRVVTDIVAVMVGDWDLARLDEVDFWRRPDVQLDSQGIVALTKVFVLEWSNEFDYQMYHHLPISLYFG